MSSNHDENFYNKVSNSRFYRFGDKLGDLMILSLLWLLFCLPIVTAIPSTAALYYAVRKRKFKKSLTPKDDFFRSLKTNLKQGIVINIIYLIYSAVVTLNMLFGYFGIAGVKLPDFYFPASFILLIPIIFTYPFMIALLARYENTTSGILKNAFTLSTMYLGTTIKIWLLLILSLAVMIVFFPAALVLPALSCGVIVKMIEKIFKFAAKQEADRSKQSDEVEEDGTGMSEDFNKNDDHEEEDVEEEDINE